MNYAIVKIGGKQFRVSEGDVLEVTRLNTQDRKIVFEDVLFVAEGDKIKVGNPTVKGAKIRASILDDRKGDKIRVAKFKSKVRYRRVLGFRPQLHQIKIEKIEF